MQQTIIGFILRFVEAVFAVQWVMYFIDYQSDHDIDLPYAGWTDVETWWMVRLSKTIYHKIKR